ncbi:MAG TPA: tetratricopeptide repeat protein, partial [Gammaproteobacteria bacterium]|nr:tetratricopeptide repeat protein [Gammaproteobacteria bacterium]
MVPAIAGLMAAAAIALPGEVTDFLPGEMLEFDQRADETRRFRTSLEAGRAYVLEVDQRELDIIVEIVAPDGTRRSFDAPLLRFEPERLLIEPEESGAFLFSLSSREYKGGMARVALQLSELARDSDADPRRVEALATETRAAELAHAGGMENWRTALEVYRSAATEWAALGAAPAEARARLAVAQLLYWRFSEWQGAASEAESAANLYAAQEDRGGFAGAIHVQGAALIESADFDQALALLGTTRDIRRALGETYEYARAVNDIGLAYVTMGNWSAARQHFGEAAEHLHTAQEWAEELKATANMAAVDYSQGNLEQALQAYQRTLDLLRPGELPAWRAQLLDNIAAANRALGNVDAALAAYARALVIHEEHESLIHRARSLSGIGVTYYGIGELERARAYLERALPLRRDAQDRPGQVSTLLFLGNVYLQQGEIDQAIEAHREAVELSVSPRERARAQVMLGHDLAAAGRSAESLEMLAIARDTAGEAGTPVVAADALLARGRLLVDLHRTAAAETELQQALQVYRELGWLTGKAKALHQLARAARAT